MFLTNTNNIEGKTFDCLGLVSASSVHAKNIGRDFMAGLKNMVGGELKGYTEMVDESKKSATEKLKTEAENLGADAVINIRYTVSSLSQGSAVVIIASGTAVKTK